MKGTWGRRVYGQVIRGDSVVLFDVRLEFADKTLARMIFVPISHLEKHPDLYGMALDALVRDLDRDLEAYLKPKSPTT